MMHRLHVRLSLLVALLVLASTATQLILTHRLSGQLEVEALQRLNLGLAHYIASTQAAELVDAQGNLRATAMNRLASHVMAINPAVEVYLLDPTGRVVSHALGDHLPDDPIGRHIDVFELLDSLTGQAPSEHIPSFGRDPIDAQHKAVVSVAPVLAASKLKGYIYVVLDGRSQRSIASSLGSSRALAELTWAACAVAMATLLSGYLLLHRVTRPIRRLVEQVRAIRPGAPASGDAEQDEIAVLRASIESLQERVEHQFAQIARADRMRRDLVGGISHDLRTPLSAARGYVETVLLKAGTLSPAVRADYLRACLQQIDRTKTRINELFELSKLEAADGLPRKETFCIAELLQDVALAFQRSAADREIGLTLGSSCQQEALVHADISLVERVIQNLVDNALRYTPRGGSINLDLRHDGRNIEVCVRDTGTGIAREHLPHVFTPYWRAPGQDPVAGGGGLGLAIVQRILELHGTTIHAESTVGSGTCFSFSLPGSSPALGGLNATTSWLLSEAAANG